MSGDGEFKKKRGFCRLTLVLNAEPDVAASLTEDGTDDHGLGGARGDAIFGGV